MFDFIADIGIPFPKTILDGSEFGQLTLPIGENTESLRITVLIEFTICKYSDGGERNLL